MTTGLQRYGAALGLNALVEELNRLYHEKEAETYDCAHPEIFEQLPPLWREMLEQFDQQVTLSRVRFLDFGCGTGFAARQCLGYFGADRIERVVCYDPSPTMLDRCRIALNGWPVPIQFVSDLRVLLGMQLKFDLLATNSVLHHLVDPLQTIRQVAPSLAPDAVWLSGHEPSKRFLQNPVLRKEILRYWRRYRILRLFSARRVTRRVLRALGWIETPEDYAARRAYETGLFAHRPPARLVGDLVDFHITHDPTGGTDRGFDFQEMQREFKSEWELVWMKAYSFLGQRPQGSALGRWSRVEKQLAERFPTDGCQTCAVWRWKGVAQ